MNFNEILELLKQKQGFTSHEQNAEYIGMSRGGYFDMKAGRGGLKDKTIEKIMEGTGLEAPQIVAAWETQNGKSRKIRESWQKWLSTAAGIIAPFVLWGNEAVERVICILC